MKYGNNSCLGWLCRWFCVGALWSGCAVILSAADYQLPFNEMNVVVHNSTDVTKNYKIFYKLGTPPVDIDTAHASSWVNDIAPGADAGFGADMTLVGGDVADEGIFPNLITIAYIDQDGEVLGTNTLPFRRDEEGNYFVPDASAATMHFEDGDTPPTEGGMTLAEFTTTQTESMAAHVEAQLALKPTQEEIMTEASEQGAAMSEALSAKTVPSLGTVTVSTQKDILHFTLPHTEIEISLDPMDNEKIAAVIPWMKAMVTWLMLATYAWWVWKQFAQLMAEAGNAQQAKGNPVVGGTGAQATAIIAAIAIGLLIVAVPAAWWALTAVDLNPLATNPFANSDPIPATAMYLVGLVLQYDLLLALITSAFVMMQGKVVILSVLQATVRAIVP